MAITYELQQHASVVQLDSLMPGNARDATIAVQRNRPAVVIIDLLMPSRRGLADISLQHGITALQTIRQTTPETLVIVYSRARTDPQYYRLLHELILLDIRGYIAKADECEHLIAEAIRRVGNGKYVYSASAERSFTNLKELTEREQDVFRLMTSGQSYEKIATTLDITRRTVNTHVSHILSKLELASMHQITAPDELDFLL